MKPNKKRKAIIGSILALAVAVPVIVFAVVYYSNSRKNTFTPAEAEILVKEKNGEETVSGDELKDQTYTMVQEVQNGTYYTNKTVQIIDRRSNPGEALRVSFVPMWTDSEGNICGGIEGVTDIVSTALIDEDSKLVFRDSSGNTVITLYLKAGWNDSWSYDEGSGCFLFSGSLSSDKSTPELITKVEISDAVHTSAKDLTLKLDVLADAIQTGGGAAEARWNN